MSLPELFSGLLDHSSHILLATAEQTVPCFIRFSCIVCVCRTFKRLERRIGQRRAKLMVSTLT